MKSLFTLIALFVASLVSAAEVRLTWDASPSTAVIGYYVYGFTNSISTNAPALKVDVGTNRVASVENLRPGIWTFTATAYNSDRVESDFASPVITEVPPPPLHMRTLTLQYTADLTTTNWQAVGFYRIKVN